jgi:pimeloyl-ACP methyl ester carboxylesterase
MQNGGSARGYQELPAPVDDPTMAGQAAVRPYVYALPALGAIARTCRDEARRTSEQDRRCGPLRPWPGRAGPPGPISRRPLWNAPTSPILVIGNTTDPFLPLQDAIAMTRQLANARLLVVRGYGHTALLNPSTCASNYMTAYFRTGALPPKGAVCRQDLPPFAPPAG